MIRRVICFIAGLCALYMWLAPRISSWPNSSPAWVSVAFFSGGLCLLAAACSGKRSGSRLAAIGSGVIVALYCWSATIMILIRRGTFTLRPDWLLDPRMILTAGGLHWTDLCFFCSYLRLLHL